MKEWFTRNKSNIAMSILAALLLTTNVSSLADKIMLDITSEVENRILGPVMDKGGK